MPHLPRPPLPSGRQLPLPLAPTELPRPGPPAAAVADLATRQVWPTLPPAMQARLRHALLRVLQEVARDAAQR
jgi:hypothetical protein